MKILNYSKLKKFKLKKISTKSPALEGNPQKKGICLKVYVTPPRKPNSAKRKVVKVKLSNRFTPIVYVPGEGHNLQQYSWVLIRGGRVKDLPGVRYKTIRNKLDLQGLMHRMHSRSKYGNKQWVAKYKKRKKIYKYK